MLKNNSCLEPEASTHIGVIKELIGKSSLGVHKITENLYKK